MSMMLRDLALLEIGYEDWNAVQGPKVVGTWNLHRATMAAGCSLDFFILFSSLSSIWGQPGQANYAAANTFLASFVQYRQEQGLPCSVVDVSIMEGVGYVAKNMPVLNQFRAMAAYTTQERYLMDAIQVSINRSLATINSKTGSTAVQGYTSMGQLTIGLRSTKQLLDPTNRTVWKRDIRMAMYRQLEQSLEDSGDGAGDSSKLGGALRELLDAAAADPDTVLVARARETQDALSWEFGRTLCSFMLQPEDTLDISTTMLAAMGVDSLVSIEIRNWWRRAFGLDVSVLEIVSAGTVAKLGELALTGLKNKYSIGKEQDAAPKGDEYLTIKAP